LRDTSTAAFAQLREACDDLRQDAAQSPFVLGCPVSVLARWMIPRLERLMADLPELSLHLRPQEAPFDETLNGLDAALLVGEPPWPSSWQVLPLARESIAPVVSPHYAKTHALAPNKPQALLGLPLLHTLSRPNAWPNWAQGIGLPAGRLQLGQAYPHLYHLIEAAVGERGVAIAPAPLVAEDLANGRLIAPWGFQETAGQWVLALPSRGPSTRGAALAAWLAREFTALT
jgi:DNA-binding transcriptional LysR family regulator